MCAPSGAGRRRCRCATAHQAGQSEPVSEGRANRPGQAWTGCGAALMPALGLRNYRPGPARRVMQEDYWSEAGQRAGFRVSLRATPRRVSESAVCDDLVRAGPDEPYVDRLRRAAYPSQARRTRDGGGGGSGAGGARAWRRGGGACGAGRRLHAGGDGRGEPRRRPPCRSHVPPCSAPPGLDPLTHGLGPGPRRRGPPRGRECAALHGGVKRLVSRGTCARRRLAAAAVSRCRRAARQAELPRRAC